MKARTLITLLVAAIVTVTGAWGQTTKNLSQFSELPEAPNAADWFYMWDTSAGVSKKISPANLFAALPNPGLTTLGGVKRNVGTAGQFVAGIDSDGSLLYDTPAGGPGGGITLTGSRVPYGDGAGSYTHEAAFTYDASNDKLVVGALGLGATAQLGVTGGGAFQFFNVTDSESINLSVSPAGNNIVTWDSSTGITQMDMGSISLVVPTEIYNATTWNNNFSVPTKDAIRDALVALPTGGDVSAAAVFGADNLLLRSDGALKGAQATGITIDDSNNITGVNAFTASSATFTNFSATNFNISSINFNDSNNTHKFNLSFGSNATADRSFSIISGDADRILTLNGDPTLGDWFDQSVKTTATPTFANVNVGAEVYGAGWDGDSGAPTKNDVYDKIQTMGGSGMSLAAYRSTPVVWDDMYYPALGSTFRFGPFGFTATITGTGAALGGVDSTLSLNKSNGTISLESGTAASTSITSINTNSGAFMFNQTSPTISYELETRILFPQANVQTPTSDEYIFRFGFIDTATNGSVADGAWIEFGPGSSNWLVRTASSTTNVSTADTGSAVLEDTWYRLTITVNSDASSIGFFVNGTQVTGSPLTNTTNIPRTASRFTGIGLQIYKGLGSTESEVNVDYVGLASTYGTSR